MGNVVIQLNVEHSAVTFDLVPTLVKELQEATASFFARNIMGNRPDSIDDIKATTTFSI